MRLLYCVTYQIWPTDTGERLRDYQLARRFSTSFGNWWKGRETELNTASTSSPCVKWSISPWRPAIAVKETPANCATIACDLSRPLFGVDLSLRIGPHPELSLELKFPKCRGANLV